jgi:hypothetical protein
MSRVIAPYRIIESLSGLFDGGSRGGPASAIAESRSQTGRMSRTERNMHNAPMMINANTINPSAALLGDSPESIAKTTGIARKSDNKPNIPTSSPTNPTQPAYRCSGARGGAA